MKTASLLFLTVFFEYVAIYMVIKSDSLMISITGYMFFHFLSSITLSNFIFLVFLLKFRKNYLKFVITNTVLLFLTSTLGLILILIIYIWLWERSKHNIEVYISTTGIDEYTDIFESSKRKFGEGGIKAFSPHLPTNIKLNILKQISLKNLTNFKHIVKEGLKDEDYEVRLLAFSILSKEEDKINKEIHKRITLLNNETLSDIEKGKIYKELGELYWELIYQELSDEELREYFLKLSKEFFNKAREILKDDVEIYFNLGKIHLRENNLKQAKKLFLTALKFAKGNENTTITEEKIYPYLAEIFYGEKSLKETKFTINKLDIYSIHPNFYFVYKMWVRDAKI